MSALLADYRPWIEILGWSLLHFVWQGALVGALFAGMRAVLPKARCDARYATGLAALTLLALCPPLTFMVLWHQQVMPSGTQALVGLAIEPYTVGQVAVDPASAIRLENLLPWLVLLWSAGVVAVTCRVWYQWHTLMRVVRDFSVRNSALESALACVTSRLRFTRGIRIFATEQIDTPTLIGWLKPVILVPVAVVLGFPADQIELILAHEISHLRRYDHLINLAQTLLETVLFYHPVVHWISREVRDERELCCDKMVLRSTLGEPSRYARTLAALEELRQPPAQMALGANGGQLLDRVHRILGIPMPMSASSRALGRAVPGVWMVIAAGVCISLASALHMMQVATGAVNLPMLPLDWLPAESRVLPSLALAPSLERLKVTLAPVLRMPVEIERASSARTYAASASGDSMRTKAIAESALIPIDRRIETRLPPPPVRADWRADLASVNLHPTVTDLHPVKPSPIVPAVSGRGIPASAPVPLSMVMPDLPVIGEMPEVVTVRFAIGADGSVWDAAVVRGNSAKGELSRAAVRAIEQWRFRPASSAAHNARYLQTFVFRPSRGNATADASCIESTGSHICRRPDVSATLLGRTPTGTAVQSGGLSAVH